MRIIGLFIISSVALTSCDLLNGGGTSAVTTEEVVKGLKTALQFGTDSATSRLNMTDGYFKDEAIKLILPKEALFADSVRKSSSFKKVTDALQISDKLASAFTNTSLGINRAAEAAAKDAKPIFVDAITGLSITDGWDILNGKNPTTAKAGTETTAFDSSAATNYLKFATIDKLTLAFSAPMKEQLDKDLGVGISATKAWESLTTSYNSGVGYYNSAIDGTTSLPININDIFKAGIPTEKLKPITTDLASYATGKALDGLFLKVGVEEKKIRRNPFAWASDIIQRVFSEGVKQLSK